MTKLAGKTVRPRVHWVGNARSIRRNHEIAVMVDKAVFAVLHYHQGFVQDFGFSSSGVHRSLR